MGLGERLTRSRSGWRYALLLVAGAVALLFAAGVLDGPRELLAAERIERLAPQIRAAASEFGLDPYLVAGVVHAESSGRVDAVSSVGAMGLMQLRPSTAAERARELGVARFREQDLVRDAALNLRLGCAYLAYLFERFGADDPRPALIAYNAGPSKAAGWFGEAGGFEPWLAKMDATSPATPGTVRHYARKVLDTAERYRARRMLEP